MFRWCSADAPQMFRRCSVAPSAPALTPPLSNSALTLCRPRAAPSGVRVPRGALHIPIFMKVHAARPSNYSQASGIALTTRLWVSACPAAPHEAHGHVATGAAAAALQLRCAIASKGSYNGSNAATPTPPERKLLLLGFHLDFT